MMLFEYAIAAQNTLPNPKIMSPKKKGFKRILNTKAQHPRKLTEYKAGKKNGIELSFDEKGFLIAEGYFINGLKHGKFKTYHSFGKLASVIIYKNDNRDGTHSKYDKNGYLVEQIEYRNGQQNGAAKWFFSGGILAAHYEYLNGALNGLQRSYLKDGTIVMEVNYENNILHGNGLPIILMQS